MTKTTSLFLAAALSAFAFACDTEDDPVVEDRAAELEASPDAVDGHRGKHHRKHGDEGERAQHFAQKLCADLECSDEQLTQIAELLRSGHEARDPEAREARKAAHREINQKIADAFAADEFDVSVLEQAKPDHEGGEHEGRMLEMAAQLHAILTPEQRAALADRIEAGGPMMFGHHGKRGHGEWGKRGRHHGEGERDAKVGAEGERERDPAARMAKKVDGVCELVTCTADQRTQLTATFEGIHDEHMAAREQREASKPDFKPFADAFRAETFDAEALRASMGATKAEHEARGVEHGKAFAATIAEIHDILTPEQRRLVADQIAEHGVRGVMGKRGDKKHSKGERGE